MLLDRSGNDKGMYMYVNTLLTLFSRGIIHLIVAVL